MKQITITEEEAKVIVIMLRSTWAPIDIQKVVYELIERLEKELSK